MGTRSGHLGVRCDSDGVFLAGAPLTEKLGSEYRVRPAADLKRLFRCAYSGKVAMAQIASGLERAALALNKKALWLAEGEAARLPLPGLPNPIAALRLEIEDLMIAAEPLRKALRRAGWDPEQHPRAGIPPWAGGLPARARKSRFSSFLKI